MKSVRLLASGIILVLAVSGCTSATPVEPAPTPREESAGSSPTSTAPRSRVLSGTFVSQAVPTSGEAVITLAPDSLVLELKEFSTSAGDDLYVTVNPGAMTRNAAGDNVVNDPTQFMLEKLRSTTGTQSYDLTYMIRSFPEVQSITIYNNSTREAFGTANLHEN